MPRSRHSRLCTAFFFFVCISLIGLTTPAAAQPSMQPRGPLTLEQALEIAEAQSESIAGAAAAVRRAEAEQVRAKSGRRPQLSGSASYDRALASEFSGVFDGGGGPVCAPFTLNPSAPLDARVAEIERAIDCGAIGASLFGGGGSGSGDDVPDLPFGRENTWRFSLAFSQSLFDGGRFDALDALAAASRDSATLAVDTTRAQLLFDVTQAYYDAALGDRLVAIAEATLNQADATFRQVEAGFKSGAQPEFELLRARVARDNQTPALIRQRANRETALLRLKQLLELPANYNLQLAAALDESVLPPPGTFAQTLVTAGALVPQTETAITRDDLPALANRTAVREVGAVVKLREAALDAAKAEGRPSVSVNSNFSQVTYPSVFFPTGDFRTNWTVGAVLQIPLLTGGRLQAEARIAQADLDQSRAQLEQVEELAALDTRSAWAELVAAQASWEASSGTIEQAVRAYQIAEVRYRAGVSTQLELSDARLLLQQSEANRAQAARDLQVARVRIALLPNLPLSPGGAVRPSPQFTVPSLPSAPQQPAGNQFRNAATQGGIAPTGVRP
jgi:outer membrane protein TolC